ncbi:MAG TPA: hypothetical protein ENK66_09660, partial [Arcobacter sp.]|nr:hypothetical protein [Arcobacter sp.]
MKRNSSMLIAFLWFGISTTVFSSDIVVQQEALIDTIVKQKQSASSIKKKAVNGKLVKFNTNGIRVMVRLKRGVEPSFIYSQVLKKNKVTSVDIRLVKSFPLVDKSVGVNGKKQKKHLMVLESSKIPLKQLMSALKKLDGVDLVEESEIISIESQNFPNDPMMDSLWGMHNDGSLGTADADIDAPEAWVKHQGINTVVVGVTDTGIDYGHADLANNMWVNESELNGQAGVDDDNNGYVDDIYGIDTYNGDTDPMDDHMHGTHVAGTIGAEGNNAEGVVGVNWNVQMIACKFLSAGGSGFTDGAVECNNYFNALKTAGVNIVATNNSWGGGGYSQILKDSIEEANNLDIVFAAAAGNESSNNDNTDTYPANYNVPNIISVASTDGNDQLSWFSNYGASKVHIAAPGSDILSTTPSSYGGCQPNGNNIYFTEGFENGDSSWSKLTINPNYPFEDLTDEHWEINSNSAATGSNSLDDSLNSEYNDNRLQTAMMKQTVDLSGAVGQSTCVSFKVKGKVETNFDSLRIIVSADNGLSWDYLDGYIDGEYTDWTQVGFSIPSAYYSENFKVALVRYNDCCISYEGYQVDDLQIGSGDFESIPNYGTISGTSMATPHVAGAIAYFASTNDTETAVERKNRILNNVDILPQLDGIVSTGGRLNINNVLTTADYQNKLDQIVGEWTFNYNWTLGTSKWTFNDDFTFTSSGGYYGTWSYNENSINIFYSTGTNYYTTNIDIEAG